MSVLNPLKDERFSKTPPSALPSRGGVKGKCGEGFRLSIFVVEASDHFILHPSPTREGLGGSKKPALSHANAITPPETPPIDCEPRGMKITIKWCHR
jgi:hypothetical protein